MITPEEFKSNLMLAYYELETALALTLSDYDELLDEKGDLLPGAIDALLIFLPDAARDIRAATNDFNEKVVTLQRRSFRLVRGGRQ